MLIKLGKEEKDHIIHQIKDYVVKEYGEDMGDLAALNWLDFIVKEIGPYLYNQGVHDAKTLIDQKMVSLEEDVDALLRPVPPLHRS